ncbi:lipase family protein [Nocardia beijingensis]|uniref:lipase family protein n=1 Tax=Nocardia beijingensis TaxID=95162 RepID=UPI00189563D3|nr:lipase family protein [Nocardia beijingensis]MBF6077867.1 lipase [Nocardia beijingensis]
MRKSLCGRFARLVAAVLGASAVCAVGASAQANPIELFLMPSREYSGILPTPLDDPFYTPPPDFESLPPGTILASRAGGTGLTAFPVRSTELLIRSTDSKDQPVPVVATLLLPQAPWTGPGPRPVLSFNAAIDSLGHRCAPSYKLRNEPTVELWAAQIPLSKGYAVLVPDHQGPRQAYAAGLMAGHAVLDSIRAVVRTPEFGLRPDAPTVVTGYSGGAIASGWAAQLAPRYAPELNLVGAAFGGVPADFDMLLSTMNGRNAASGVFLAATLGLAREYPELLGLMNDDGWRLAQVGKDLCMTAEELGGAVAPIPVQALTHAAAPTELPMVREILAANRLGASAPTVPVFLYHATHDPWVPLAGAEKLYADWCGAGTPVDFQVYFGEHFLVGLSGIPGANSWIDDRFAGRPVAPQCTRSR